MIFGDVWKADGFNLCMFTAGFPVVNPLHHDWPKLLQPSKDLLHKHEVHVSILSSVV